MARDTGLPSADAQFDFSRARRRRALARLSARLRREPDDVNHILPFEEVARALGRIGERRLGQQLIPLDSIVGTVDRAREFDRDFRPTSPRVRERWQRINTAQRKGRGDAADRRLPDRRAALREGRAPQGVRRARARAQGHQRLRDRGADPGGRRPRDPAEGPPAEEPPAAVLRARSAARRRARAASSSATSGATQRSPRPWRPGAFGRAVRPATSCHARRSPRPGSGTSTSRSSRCCARRSS